MKTGAGVFYTQDFGPVTRDLVLMAGDQFVKIKDPTPDPNEYTPCNFKDPGKIIKAIAIVHTELILIHPFRDGNGRVGRLLSFLMALQAKLPPLDFTEIKGKKKQEYFEAVQAGMDRNYGPMEKIFREVIDRTPQGHE